MCLEFSEELLEKALTAQGEAASLGVDTAHSAAMEAISQVTETAYRVQQLLTQTLGPDLESAQQLFTRITQFAEHD